MTTAHPVNFGHHTGTDTGVTVAYFGPDGAVASVDVRGGGPGTRETDLLAPHNTVQRVHAIVLAGGSAFGLAAADGAMRALADNEVGFPVGPVRVPIVPGAVIFDLLLGPNYPSATDGHQALVCALATDDPAVGSVGGGTGASAGRLRGGFGRHQTAVETTAGSFQVGAGVVANPVGEVIDAETGRFFGAPQRPGVDIARFGALRPPWHDASALNTTIGVIYTDAPLTKAQCRRLAIAGHDGIARAISPAHLPMDGDTLFAVSTAPVNPTYPDGANPGVGAQVLAGLCAAGAQVVQDAIVDAVASAQSGLGMRAYRDMLR